MASHGPIRDYAGRRAPSSGGPAAAFAGCVLLVFTGAAAFSGTLHPTLVLPALVGLLFALTALVALAACLRPAAAEPRQLSYWDVAGGLAFIGIGLSVLVEPEQVAMLVGGADGRR
jgi:hypothetical protein